MLHVIVIAPSVVVEAVLGMTIVSATASCETIFAAVRVIPNEFAFLAFPASQVRAAWCFASGPPP